uniref:Uncharacterized protein n=1 Tax=Utricularia reniformis TaxID=192314 RepID=A0A1Y0B277_9LAMI|nr:hypothetical protein AEK19_MT1293 [Utricularia reniformis]ART31497.1 hypothetical protein AEK19_MT1293 [Utricularia reniformis]
MSTLVRECLVIQIVTGLFLAMIQGARIVKGNQDLA